MSLDNFRNRTIIWDTVNKDFPQPIQVMQGDVNARTLLIKIVENGVEIDLTGHSLKLTYQYTNSSNSGFVVIPPKDLAKGEFILVIPTEMTTTGVIEANLILLNESLEQVIVSKSLTFISDNSTVTNLAQEVNNKIDDFTKLLLENMPQVLRSELNDLHAQTDSNKSNIELKANLADMTSLQSAMTDLKNEVEAFGISPENLVTIKSLLDAIASNASESEVVELINSVKVLTSNISLMSNGDYSPKANQTDLESLQHTVNDHSATISTKANQTDLDNLQATVDKQGKAISTKAEQSDLSITNKNVATAQETANKAESEAKNAMAKATEAQANSLPLTGIAVSAIKLATPRKLGVNLQSSSFQDFDGTADATNIGVSGVLPIAKYSDGSELNMFLEYNMATRVRFSEYFGFSDEEVDMLYQRYLEKTKKPQITRESLREWYDGYHTAAGERLYNPRSVVCALTDNQLSNYWVSSGKYDSIFTYIQYNVDQIQNDLTLMFAGERIPSGIQEYAATAQELKTKEEIYSAMVVYGLLTYDNGMVFIPNKELMEVLKWELVMIKKQKNTPVK